MSNSAAEAPNVIGNTMSTSVMITPSKIEEALQNLNNGDIKEGSLFTRKSTGGLAVPVYDCKNSKNPLRVQFGTLSNPLTTPFGVKLPELTDEQKRKGETVKDPFRKNLDVSVSRETHPLYFELIKTWDEHNMKVFVDRSVEFFQKQRSLDSVRDSMVPMLVFPHPPKDPAKAAKWDRAKNEKYDPTQRFKIVTDGDQAARVYKVVESMKQPNGKTIFKRVLAHADDIKPFSKVVVTADNIGFWFLGGAFGNSWQISDITFFPPEERNAPSNYRNDDDEEVDDTGSVAIGYNNNNNMYDEEPLHVNIGTNSNDNVTNNHVTENVSLLHNLAIVKPALLDNNFDTKLENNNNNSNNANVDTNERKVKKMKLDDK